jgi:hypothetical protein
MKRFRQDQENPTNPPVFFMIGIFKPFKCFLPIIHTQVCNGGHGWWPTGLLWMPDQEISNFYGPEDVAHFIARISDQEIGRAVC